jgi:hypothetical protein
MSKVAIKEPDILPAPQDETTQFVSMIERAARDPQINIDKLERLLAMKERQELRVAEQAFNEAMSKAQAEMRPVAADLHNSQTRSRYASYAALDRAMRPIYTKHGLSLSFDTEAAGEGYITVICLVSSGGYTRRYSVPMPADGKGAKGGDVMTKTHAVGAAMTYGQRYLLKMIFNIAIGDDNDGNTPQGSITDEQVKVLRGLITETGANIDKFLAWAGVESLPDMPAGKFEGAKAMLEAKKGK